MTLFHDRMDAGKQLAEALTSYTDGIVIGLPRGGVVVAAQVAKRLNLPLDITCPRKIGAPDNPEYALGAVTERGEAILRVPLTVAIKQIIEKEKLEAKRRHALYATKTLSLQDKTVIIVDDGLATGSTMLAAIASIKAQNPAKIVVAVPVAPPHTAANIAPLVDDLVILATPPNFYAVGQFYTHFASTPDDEVIALLQARPQTQ